MAVSLGSSTFPSMPIGVKDPTRTTPLSQVLLDQDNKLPAQYVFGELGSSDESFPQFDVPVLDYSLFMSSSATIREAEMEKLHSALTTCGCIQLINTGMEDSFLDEFDEMLRQFVALPAEEKKKYARSHTVKEGYGKDTVLVADHVLDWQDRLYLTLYPEERRNLRFWPTKPENFKEMLYKLEANLKATGEVLLKAMAKSLNIDEGSFWNPYVERGNLIARFNFYPPCARPDLALACRAHSDGSAFTFLVPDKDAHNLQLLFDDKWYSVTTLPHSLLLNVGDHIEVASNGIYKSPVHRVIANSEKQRNTLAIFINYDETQEIEVLEELITAERPRMYKNLKDYSSFFLRRYQECKIAVHDFKIGEENTDLSGEK